MFYVLEHSLCYRVGCRRIFRHIFQMGNQGSEWESDLAVSHSREVALLDQNPGQGTQSPMYWLSLSGVGTLFCDVRLD